jgi:hypothetical protein
LERKPDWKTTRLEDSETVDNGLPKYAFFVDAVMDDNMAENSVTVDDDRAFFLL